MWLVRIYKIVGSLVQAIEFSWHYVLPKLENEVATIGIGVDGANLFLSEEGYRETMVGTISFYDGKGERLRTIYQAAAPSSGKATFWLCQTCEILDIKKRYRSSELCRYCRRCKRQPAAPRTKVGKCNNIF